MWVPWHLCTAIFSKDSNLLVQHSQLAYKHHLYWQKLLYRWLLSFVPRHCFLYFPLGLFSCSYWPRADVSTLDRRWVYDMTAWVISLLSSYVPSTGPVLSLSSSLFSVCFFLMRLALNSSPNTSPVLSAEISSSNSPKNREKLHVF